MRIRSMRVWFVIGLMLSLIDAACAASTIGAVASGLTHSFAAIGRLITGGSYVAGLGFVLGAIMKFKQHKDNPTQIPIGTPIALLFVGCALLFLPSLLNVVGGSMFGSGSFKTAGPSGMTITS